VCSKTFQKKESYDLDDLLQALQSGDKERIKLIMPTIDKYRGFPPDFFAELGKNLGE
jgi:hypothetical protein